MLPQKIQCILSQRNCALDFVPYRPVFDVVMHSDRKTDP